MMGNKKEAMDLRQVMRKQDLVCLMAGPTGYTLTAEPPEEALEEISLDFASEHKGGKVQRWCNCRFGIERDINSAAYIAGAMSPTIMGIFTARALASAELEKIYGARVGAQVVRFTVPQTSRAVFAQV